MLLRRLICALFIVTCFASVGGAQSLIAPGQGSGGGIAFGDLYTFSWGRVDGATWYQIYITDAAGMTYQPWYTSNATQCDGGQRVCSVTAQFQFLTGNAFWWVRAWGPPDVYSPWSPGQRFTVMGRITDNNNSITVLGRQAMQATGTIASGAAGDHVAVGHFAMNRFNAGTSSNHLNTAVGRSALEYLLSSGSASRNTAIGGYALLQLQSGSYNVAVGEFAGTYLTTGSDNAYFANYGVPGTAESNTMRLGQFQTRAFMAGVYSRTSAGGVNVFINSSGQLGTATSSQRFKQNIRPIGAMSERLFDLRPVAFEYKPDIDTERIPQFGLIAEEVEKVFPELVVKNDKGEADTVRYHFLVPMLLNELQKQRKVVDEQTAKLLEQERRLNELAQRVEMLLRQER